MIYALLGDASLSEAYLTKYHEAVAKISDKNLHNSLQEMEVKYNVQQKDLELERRQSVISRQKTRQYLLSGGLSGAILLLALLVYIVRLHRRRNRELAETNATKDKFFSIISHDLKTPAVAQRDALQLLLENSDKWDAASLTNYYKKLLKSANGQVDLLYTLLNWAQLQTGRMPYNPTLFDLTTALQSCIGIINSMAENKSVTFDVQTPETALVTGDYNMLTTVVRNLLVNAVKFTPKGGSVTLTISDAHADAHAGTPLQSHIYTVSVSDTGTGMTPDQIQNLFRLDRKQSRKGTSGEEGAGLGLIVCKDMLTTHGATLRIESEAGKGSKFWFDVPIAPFA